MNGYSWKKEERIVWHFLSWTNYDWWTTSQGMVVQKIQALLYRDYFRVHIIDWAVFFFFISEHNKKRIFVEHLFGSWSYFKVSLFTRLVTVIIKSIIYNINNALQKARAMCNVKRVEKKVILKIIVKPLKLLVIWALK